MSLFKRRDEAPVPTIDLREVEPEPVRPEGPMWGMPTVCPECGGRGYLDRINLRDRTMEQHCPTCFHRWSTSEAECVAEA